jgi:hypothetical protein
VHNYQDERPRDPTLRDEAPRRQFGRGARAASRSAVGIEALRAEAPSDLQRLIGEFGLPALRRLRLILPPAPHSPQALIGSTDAGIVTALVERGLLEVVVLDVLDVLDVPDAATAPAVRLSERGRAVARAVLPGIPDYVVDRGCGAPRHLCDTCQERPSTRSVRVHRPGLFSRALVEAHYFCDIHGAASEQTYQNRRAFYLRAEAA